jgi:hypothetical protein
MVLLVHFAGRKTEAQRAVETGGEDEMRTHGNCIALHMAQVAGGFMLATVIKLIAPKTDGTP